LSHTDHAVNLQSTFAVQAVWSQALVSLSKISAQGVPQFSTGFAISRARNTCGTPHLHSEFHADHSLTSQFCGAAKEQAERSSGVHFSAWRIGPVSGIPPFW
jgi:hypothetical protein